MDTITAIFSVAILILSVAIHEAAHGYMADYLGDPTPRYAGRLTLNPLKHLDLMGSLVVPALLVITKSPFVLGWAKPVIFNPHNIKNRRWGSALVAAAGPASNLVIAIILGLLVRFADPIGLSLMFTDLLTIIVYINLILMVFNLIPVAPLDGHHILFAILGPKHQDIIDWWRRYSIGILIVVIFFGWKYIAPISDAILRLITGI